MRGDFHLSEYSTQYLYDMENADKCMVSSNLEIQVSSLLVSTCDGIALLMDDVVHMPFIIFPRKIIRSRSRNMISNIRKESRYLSYIEIGAFFCTIVVLYRWPYVGCGCDKIHQVQIDLLHSFKFPY